MTDTSGGDDVGLSEDDVAGALTNAFQAKNVAVEDGGVSVTTSDGLFHLSVRLSATAAPLPQPDDSGNTPNQVAAALLVLGAVQLVEDATRVTMRIVVVETSEIKETGSGDATGVTSDAVEAAAETAISQLPTLNP